ncbi:MAG: hypothetical protein RR131_09060, partial [Anaerovorax sp.]
FTKFCGPVFGILFLAVAVISQCSIFNTYIASGSRGFFVLADDNLCPKFLVKVSKKRGVPYVGILSLAGVTVVLSQFEFTTLVMAEVVFILALYMVLSISVVILRKKIPLHERKGLFVIPFGKVGLYLFTGLPFCIAILALILNGVDYFIIGLLATATGPIAYVILKRKYGGRYVTNGNLFPMNEKTKLAKGDLFRIAAYLGILGIFAIVGSFALFWYEGSWGAQYYLETYKTGLFSSFTGMLGALRYFGSGVVILSAVLFFAGKKIEGSVLEKDF